MKVTIKNKVFETEMDNNATAKAFMALFPLTVEMTELNGNEKYHYLSTPIAQDEPIIPQEIKAGDLMLFGDSCIVLFYQDFSTAYSYIPLGHCKIEGDFAEFLNEANPQVRFEI